MNSVTHVICFFLLFLAHRFQRHKAMFMFFVLLTAAAFLSIKYIDPIAQKTNVAFHCNDGVSVLKHCPSTFDQCATTQLINYTDSVYTNVTQPMEFHVSYLILVVVVANDVIKLTRLSIDG